MTTHINKTRKKLTALPKHAAGIVVAITHADDKTKNRLSAMGIYKGCKIIRKNSSLPVVADIAGTEIALGREFADKVIVETEQKIIFLLGNPNVGKSTLFSRLTGIRTDASNYPGTTVNLLSGETHFNKNPYTIYDMPGVYSLEEECQTAQESCALLRNAPYDFAVYVADARHLERNLFFALDVIALGKPTVLLLNKFDAAAKKGIIINVKQLSQMLGVPVIACEGITGKGLPELAATVDKLSSGKLKYHAPQLPQNADDKWKLIGQISAAAQKIIHRHPSLLERIEEAASTPLLATALALAVMALSFLFILHGGGLLINLLTPVYENYYLPFMHHIFRFSENTVLWPLLFGGAQGFGILSEGVKIAFIDVFSYVMVFYIALEFLADLGYLPRLAVLMDSVLHRLGLHGYSAIPLILGLGCKVPALMAARTLETRRQRIIVFALILMMTPCISQTAVMFSVLAPYGLKYLLLTFAAMFTVGVGAAYFLNKFLPGDTSDIFMEVPHWQLPRPKIFIKKIFTRAKEYLKEAAPLILAGMLIISAADMIGLANYIVDILRFPLSAIMGLPADAAPAVLLGFLRKDISIALLVPFALTAKQMVIACVFMAMYLPCAGSCFVLLKEAGWRDAMLIMIMTFCTALATAGVLNLIL